MWTKELLIQFITAMLGTLGFSLMFKLDKKHLFVATLGGGFTFFVYYVFEYLTSSLFASVFISSCASAVLSEFLARCRKAPTMLFIVPCVVPIIPGGSLYRTMFNLISGNLDLSWKYLTDTLLVAIGIAGGLAAVSLVFHIITAAIVHIKFDRNKGC